MKQKGFLLISSLIFLLLLSIVAISIFSSFTTNESISGNFREKNRALDAAQTALTEAQFWMVQPQNLYTGNWNTGTTCASGANTSTPVVCSNALPNPATLPWTYSSAYYQPSAGAGTYASQPNYYIQYLGNIDNYNALYQVTATSSGGNSATTAVVQAVYQVNVTSADIGGP